MLRLIYIGHHVTRADCQICVSRNINQVGYLKKVISEHAYLGNMLIGIGTLSVCVAISRQISLRIRLFSPEKGLF